MNDFLIKAKINTYASNGEGNEIKHEDGTRELIFVEGNFVYKDRYYGYNPFLGEEIVWEKNKPVWGMNYYGKILDDFDSKILYSFLKKALLKVPKNAPFRGPKELVEDNLKYINEWDIKGNSFNGKEIIYFNNKIVYELYYHGANIKEKSKTSI